VLIVRTLLAIAMFVCGLIILVRVLVVLPVGRFAILPGVVLGGAMIALGLHRLSLIARVRGMRR
jgi:hypothetical protein